MKKSRIRNSVARDLRTPKYRARVERNRKRAAKNGEARVRPIDLLGI
jgi:hypothetical protein